MSDDNKQQLDELRGQLNGIDEDILRLIKARQNVVEQIGRVKQRLGRGTRDFGREKVVIQRVRGIAERLEVDPDTAEAIFGLLIEQALETQERERLVAGGDGRGRPVLVIGGAGQMGAWFSSFLDAQGYAVTVADPARELEGFQSVKDWETLDLDTYHLIVVATPIRECNNVLTQLASHRPSGVVFDISSLKDPVRPGLEALREQGVRVTSVHPLFGPNVGLLSGRHVVFVDVGDREALDVARDLFADTMARTVAMNLEEHDRAMSFVLGLSHALNIVFADALARSGERFQRLGEVSSTTFANQLRVTSAVAHENPYLYFEIQALNPYADETLAALSESVEALRGWVQGQDESSFLEMMQRGRNYLDTRSDDSEAR